MKLFQSLLINMAIRDGLLYQNNSKWNIILLEEQENSAEKGKINKK